MHFLLTCPKYKNERDELLFKLFSQTPSPLIDLSHNTFKLLVNNFWKDTVYYLVKCYEIRQHHLYILITCNQYMSILLNINLPFSSFSLLPLNIIYLLCIKIYVFLILLVNVNWSWTISFHSVLNYVL